jgi:hypothetical protein
MLPPSTPQTIGLDQPRVTTEIPMAIRRLAAGKRVRPTSKTYQIP